MAFVNHMLMGLALLSSATAATLPQARNYPTGPQPKAVYFMSNDLEHNSIHALPVKSNGQVDYGRVTATGGKGGRAPAPMLTDSLNSQGALQRIGNTLLAVNAGSNTLSMFSIDENDPTQLTLVGKPVDTLGDFPNTIAISDKLKDLACVANTGTRSGVACFKITSTGLKCTDDSLRPLPLHPQQATPPNGPFNTVSQIFFNVEATALYATVKGDPTVNNTGYFGSFPISSGVVGRKLTTSSPAGTAVLFGSVALPGDKVFTTDASFGAATLQVSKSGVATTLDKYAVPDNKASCWAVVSPATGLGYITDDGSDHVVAFDPATSTPKATTNLQNGNPNMIEIVAFGSMLYAISHGNSTWPPHVIVMATDGPSGSVTAIQNFAPRGVGVTMEGMAVYG